MNKIKILVLTIIIVVILLATIFIFTADKDELFTTEVIDEYDDGRTFVTGLGGFGYENEIDAWAALQLSPSYSFGVRFRNVTIPKGAEIKSAYVELHSMGTPGLHSANCIIYLDDTDDAVNFSQKGVLEISGRNYTSNKVIWNETLEMRTWVKTPSLVEPLQEVINRENWSYGNSIAVLFVTNGLRDYSIAFDNFATENPARIYITWQKTE